MLTSLPFSLVIGTVLGFLTGIGIGGGSLLILWLSFVLHMDPASAKMINLLFFLPSALVAILFRWRQGKLDLPVILPAVISGCIGTILITRLTAGLNTEILKKIFGVVLIITGIRELFHKSKKDR